MRILLAVILFLELTTLGVLGGVILIGRLPENPFTLLWLLGAVLGVSALLAVGLPTSWTGRVALHGALIAGAVIFALPFVWLVGTSFKYPEETFVYPPRWVPELPTAVERSPYIANADDVSLPDTFDADRMWTRAAGYLDPVEVAELSPQERSRFAHHLADLLQRSGRDVSRDADFPADFALQASRDLYRAVSIGAPQFIDPLGGLQPPSEMLDWSASEGATLVPAGRTQLVRYDLSDRDTLSVTGRCVQPDIDVAGFTLRMRQDRSWHRLNIKLDYAGRQYTAVGSLHLGAAQWVEWTFRLPKYFDPQTQQTGEFEMKPTGDAPDGATRLTFEIHQSSPVAATWSKYVESYRQAWRADRNWPRYLFNSVLIVVLSVVGNVLSCSMVAYAFARLRWPGRDSLFLLLLATMMLPGAVTMVPVFLIFKSIGLYNTLLPMWLPAFFGAPFFIFLTRQFMRGIPTSLEEAARIDGCNWFGIYWRIILPLMKPALAAVAIFTFMGAWNEFIGPLIYLNDPRKYPLSLGLYQFSMAGSADYNMLMAASTMMTVPIIAVFFLAQRFFIEGVTLTGMKN